PAPQIPPDRWGDTRVLLPEALGGRPLERLFDGTTVTSQQAGVHATELLQQLPVALLQLTTVQQENQDDD
ncbi:hypothetical protein, partial [Pseudomonas sp.]|uniref:hypothetical protein n=1 Tax=Pseudomonas sp. TaxID=306 RepID=UPI00289B1D20